MKRIHISAYFEIFISKIKVIKNVIRKHRGQKIFRDNNFTRIYLLLFLEAQKHNILILQLITNSKQNV